MINLLVRTFVRTPLLALVLAAALAVWGWQSFEENPKDAIPDIAENQVIVFTEWMGRSPKDVDEQVTYPLTVSLQGVPEVKEIRATSGFGWSIVYVVFRDNAEFYWARSRVLERLNVAAGELPDGVTPVLGPDATALGQVFWYTVENGWYSPERPGLRFKEDGTLTDASRETLLKSEPDLRETIDEAEPYRCPATGAPLVRSRLPLDRLRSIQDFDVKLALQNTPGVAEVASIGGYVRQYQVDLDPELLRAFDVSVAEIVGAIKASNLDVGAKVIEQNGMEFIVRGVGFLGGEARNAAERAARENAAIKDIEQVVIKAVNGTPVYVDQVAEVSAGPDFRRGALDKLGVEAVGGCVVMRFGENPLSIIEHVKDRVAEIEPGLPPGVRVNAFYDRSQLIDSTMGTLTEALSQELAITVIAVLLFLLHIRSSIVVAATLPLAVCFAFICMQALELPSNIMSLAGIAIAIGTMVDMAIVMAENIYQHLTDRRDEFVSSGEEGLDIDAAQRRQVIEEAATEVAPAIVTAIATTVVSFIPVFFLEGQAAKLFTPLAWTKTFCMVGAVLLALTIVPPLGGLLLRHRRIRWRWAIPWAAVCGAAAAVGVHMADAWAEAAHVRDSLATYLRLSETGFALLVGGVVALLVLVMLRERIRPISRNPVSRGIRFAYEPLLRLILAHKLLFGCVVAAVVLWGLSIWLGWSSLVAGVLAPFHWAGLQPEDISYATVIHLMIALVLGFALVPLVYDTVRFVFGNASQPQVPSRRHAFARLGVIAVAVVGLTWVFNAVRLADRSRPVRALARSVWPDAVNESATSLRDARPLAALVEGHDGIGQEFMPPLDEGDFLYMPSVLPAGSLNTVLDVMQKQDVQFGNIPEVAMVVGKLGRIESALDPAPVGMLETMILLKPRSEWPVIDDPNREGNKRRRTMDEIWGSIQEAGRFPGVLPSVQLQPIRTRVEMLSTGLSAKIGLKIYGDSLARCEELAVEIEQLLRKRLDHAEAVNAIRVSGKPYLEYHLDREAAARYGLKIDDIQRVIETALGGRNITTTFEGLDRYPVRVRYLRELRDEAPELERMLVRTHDGAQIPISHVAELKRVVGPMSVRREGAKYVSYVTMNNVGIDEVSLVNEGRRIIDQAIINGELDLPDGYTMRWAGSYERNLRASKRLAILVPLVLLVNFLLIHLQFRRLPLTIVIFLAIPVAFSGGFILLENWPAIQNALYGIGLMDRPFPGDAMYLTVAVWVGFIALFGIAVDDGIVMSTYLDQSFSRTPIRDEQEIIERTVEAGLRRIRPCLMTTFTTLAALIPVLLATGRGSELMTPMALPVFGGMVAAMLTLFVVPTGFCAIKQWKWRWGLPDRDFERPEA